jgi:hypothetical protein
MPLPDEIAQTTEALEELPHMLGHKNTFQRQHGHMLQEMQTDVLPSVTPDISTGVTWWQARQFREENEYLRPLLEQQRAEMHQLTSKYNDLKGEFDREIASIHHSHQQELAHYQQRLQSVVAEHNQLHNAYQDLKAHYQELFHNFQECVEEEAQKKIMQVTQTVLESPEKAPVLFPDLVKAIEQDCRQKEDKSLAEALSLKREVYRIARLLEHEHQQLKDEYQQLLFQQENMQKKAEALRKTLQARWKMISVMASLGLVASLVLFQFVFLSLFQVHLTAVALFSIIAPLLLCLLLALALATRVGLLKHMHLGVSDKKSSKR